MNTKEFKLQIKKKLLQIDSASEVYANPDEIQLRCQFCGDSKKDLTKRRLYIKMNMGNDDLPILYNCFNCGASGVLTPSILRTLKIHDLQLNSSLVSYNNRTINSFNKKMGIVDNNISFIIPRPLNTPSNIKKKKYIEERLGISISAQELVELKTIFSFEQFLKENNIDSLTVKNSRAIELNNDYVGFLTAKNEFINFRDITNKYKLRYDKYSIYRNLDNTRKFYTIPTCIDLLSNEPININLAEGVFDIFGVYFHIFNKNKTNNVYAAICGSAYVNVIKYFIQLGIMGDNVTINIFSDSDHPPYFYKGLKKELSMWVKEINLYYNELSKDFGVPKDQIQLISKKIK